MLAEIGHREECSATVSPEDRALRILHVVPHLGSGGAEQVMLTLLNALDPGLYATRICVLGSEPRCRVRVIGEPVFFGYAGSLRDMRGLCRCVRELRSVICEFKADIIHSHLWPAARIASLAAVGSSAAHLVHIHDAWPWLTGGSLRERMMRLFTRWTLSRVDSTYLAVSHAAGGYTRQHLRIADRRMEVVHNGIDCSRFQPAEGTRRTATNGRLVIGHIGRFSPEKGQDILLRAVAELSQRGIECELHFAGEGSLQASCVTLARELGLAGRVHFWGFVEDVPSFLQTLDLLALPSLTEGFPITVLEAMAAGLPIVATHVGGIPEMIIDGYNGILVPPGDTGALTSALEALATNIGQRRYLGSNALHKVRADFALEGMCRRIEAIYSSLGHPHQDLSFRRRIT